MVDIIEFSTIAQYLIPVGAVLGLGLFCAIMYERSFSMNIFLATIAIGFAVCIWIGLVPTFFFAVIGLSLIGIIFSNGGGSPDE